MIFFFLDTIRNITNEDLIDTNVDDELSILDIFDPFRQSKYEPELDTTILDTSSPSFPYPIQIRLKRSTCSEMKPFCQLVQQIRDEHQSKEVKETIVIFFFFFI